MPIYEYRCQNCGHRFEKLVRTSNQAVCPACDGARLERLLSAFAVGAAGDTADLAESPGACHTCGDPRGPGACALN
jgi:putative FmdB family regulatory protein